MGRPKVKNNTRVLLTLASLVTLCAACLPRSASAASAPEVAVSVQNYTAAWQAMATALDENRPDLLNANFVGTAADKLTDTITEQRKAGLHQRYIDKGHKVDAVFYSPEGSAIELRDTAQLQIQLLDGDKVVHSEDVTVHYIALLTAAADSWKVRVLEAVPSF
jgi:hypothetical protein